MTPCNWAVAHGTTPQFGATGTYFDSTTEDLTHSVMWSPLDPTATAIKTLLCGAELLLVASKVPKGFEAYFSRPRNTGRAVNLFSLNVQMLFPTWHRNALIATSLA